MENRINRLYESLERSDEQLIELLAERLETATQLARLRKQAGLPLTDESRERQSRYCAATCAPENVNEFAPQLLEFVHELERGCQLRELSTEGSLAHDIAEAIEKTPQTFPETATVACQGTDGANSQLACDRLFRRANIMFVSDFSAVFTSVEKGLCRYGVIPVENSTAGSVNSVYDLMMDHNFRIVRSLRMRVEHDLLAKPGAKLEDICEIYSHEQALSQCADFIRSLGGVRAVPCENTAAAAKMVAESGRGDIAALASRECLKYYPLESLKRSVQDSDGNYTRFVCISRNMEIYPGASRTSLMLTLPHKPGSLYGLLSKIYAYDVNLVKLESRPLPGSEFEFMFYFDLDAPVYSPRFRQLIGELQGACDSFAYLGSYNEII